MAKSLVRNRHAVTKMYGLKSQLQAVSLRMATLKSTQAMADAMRGATKVSHVMLALANSPCDLEAPYPWNSCSWSYPLLCVSWKQRDAGLLSVSVALF